MYSDKKFNLTMTQLSCFNYMNMSIYPNAYPYEHIYSAYTV